jgi:hypothetical protein
MNPIVARTPELLSYQLHYQTLSLISLLCAVICAACGSRPLAMSGPTYIERYLASLVYSMRASARAQEKVLDACATANRSSLSAKYNTLSVYSSRELGNALRYEM